MVYCFIIVVIIRVCPFEMDTTMMMDVSSGHSPYTSCSMKQYNNIIYTYHTRQLFMLDIIN